MITMEKPAHDKHSEPLAAEYPVGSVPCPAAPRCSARKLIEQLFSRSMARHPLVLGLADGRADEDAAQRPDIKPAGPLVPAEASDAVDEVLAALRTLGLADQRCLDAHSALSARLKALVASTDRCERLGALLAAHIAVGQLRGADVPLRDDLAGLAGMLPQQADAVAGMRTGAFAAHRLIWQTLDELHALRSS